MRMKGRSSSLVAPLRSLHRVCCQVFVHLPAAYVSANLLRHVDTPCTPVGAVFGLTFYSATPFLLLEEVCTRTARA